MAPKKTPPTSTLKGRAQAVRVKTAKKRSNSSALWLARQLNDPYVQEAKRLGYRSRAAFKILQLQEKYRFLKPGMAVVDLGAAPGGWSQVIVNVIGKKGTVLALDILPIDPLPDVHTVQYDFYDEAAPTLIKTWLGARKADCVLSDMAAPTTGHASTDHVRIMDVCAMAFDLARDILAPNGTFVCKALQGGTEQELLGRIKKEFKAVHHAKPAASRADSAEVYLVALGFRGDAGA
jgi:23S rRNA (uridine2552-2'-O)-methyltransferase